MFITTCGIDIGTTTVHLCFSRLHTCNTAPSSQAPRIVIGERETFYQSIVYETPLTGDGAIEATAVAEFVKNEFRKARLERASVQSGAVIITGETARLRNAEQVSSELSELAGDFVVASAGPNLESLLSARGSGACLESKRTGKTICNLDVGGGTINAAICRDGDVVASSCLRLGGRFVRLTESGEARGWTEAGRTFAHAVGFDEQPGSKLSPHQIRCLTDALANCVVHWIYGHEACNGVATQDLLMTQRLLLTQDFHGDYSIDELRFSGGVASLMEELRHGATPAPLLFGDAGVYLARSLLKVMAERNINYSIAADSIRATVLGAAMHAVQLSGSTVTISAKVLPLKNIPIVKLPPLSHGALADLNNDLHCSISEALRLRDIDWCTSCIALAIAPDEIDYSALKRCAGMIANAFIELRGKEPLIVATAADIGLALGQILRSKLGSRSVIVVDSVKLDDGDYIDIGRPCTSASDLAAALPVVVKTLIFK